MRYHDFHLQGYSVKNSGSVILLHLMSDNVEPREESTIEFSEVSAYHFIHTGGAIITEITEMPLDELLRRWGSSLGRWCRQHGGNLLWDDDLDRYRRNLEEEGYRAWDIESAIGFEGFVIAKAVREKERPESSGLAG